MNVASSQQVDLFLDQLVDGAPFKDDRMLMEHPWFSLTKQPRRTPFHYSRGGVDIRIEPGAKGMANIYDKDLLMYLGSIINEKLERGEKVSDRKITFAAHDFLRSTKRQTSKRGYTLFLDMLERLDGTRVRTNVESGNDKIRSGFGWIESYRIIERKTKNGRSIMAGVEVTLNEWMFKAIVIDRRVLTISPRYFDLSKGLERRIYELARKHCGQQRSWLISIPSLKEKCGSDREERKFRADLGKIIEDGNIPDYSLRMGKSADFDSAFKSRNPKEWMLEVRPIRPQSDETLDAAANPAEESPEKLFERGDAQFRPKPLSIHVINNARERFPDWDIDHLEREWASSSQRNQLVIKDPEKAFMAFCERYVANRSIDM
ncbi:hypothetical protein LF95_22480 [Thalassospira sp. TSL5-1]|nr:hypothetical protein LF95_22480 [Thalassospira sp. TSL5-1]